MSSPIANLPLCLPRYRVSPHRVCLRTGSASVPGLPPYRVWISAGRLQPDTRVLGAPCQAVSWRPDETVVSSATDTSGAAAATP